MATKETKLQKQQAPPAGQQALALADQFKALQVADLESVKEIMESNFGAGQALNFNDLDMVTLPAGGGIQWEVITLEGTTSTPELTGAIVAWGDKKAWWPVQMEDSDGGPPVCRADQVWDNRRKGIGLGNPMAGFNEKEEKLLAANPTLRREPLRVGDGWDCGTCIHNQFGSHAKHGGKSCQDKRVVLMLDKDSLLPFVIRLPATSIQPLQEYFGRLARNGIPYFAAITTLRLEKDKSGGGITYSKIVAEMAAQLSPEHTQITRTYSRMLMPMIQGGNASGQPALWDAKKDTTTPPATVPAAPAADQPAPAPDQGAGDGADRF